MKNNIIYTIILLMIFVFNTYGQLKVKDDGTVKIGYAIAWPSGGNLEIVDENKTTEARIFAASSDIARLWTMNSIYSFGFGIDENGYGHIYKNVNQTSTIATFKSNGYFGIGEEIPEFKLDVNGSIQCVVCHQTSDIRLKNNINAFNEVNKLRELNAITYNFNEEALSDNSEAIDSSDFIVKDGIEQKRIYYGFSGQDVQKTFPDVVYEDSQGFLSIDYSAFIPMLIEGYKGQQTMIEELEAKIEVLENGMTGKEEGFFESDAKLYQNTPNPFSESTIIKYYLPDDIMEAYIYIYNMQGTQLKSNYLKDTGDASITINANEFEAGMYMYTLIVDNKVVDTKEMILTN